MMLDHTLDSQLVCVIHGKLPTVLHAWFCVPRPEVQPLRTALIILPLACCAKTVTYWGQHRLLGLPCRRATSAVETLSAVAAEQTRRSSFVRALTYTKYVFRTVLKRKEPDHYSERSCDRAKRCPSAQGKVKQIVGSSLQDLHQSGCDTRQSSCLLSS